MRKESAIMIQDRKEKINQTVAEMGFMFLMLRNEYFSRDEALELVKVYY